MFTLITNDTESNVRMLSVGDFIYMPGKITAMVIKYVEYDSEQSTITANGYTTLELVDQRILLGTYLYTDVEVGIKKVLADNLRGFNEISIEETLGLEAPLNYVQYSNAQLLEMFIELCTEAGLGMRMKFDYKNKTHVFQMYKGLDRTYSQTVNTPATFSDDWGSLGDVLIINDESVFKNYAYVFGQGEGADRIYTTVGSPRGAGRDVHELVIDARDLQWQDDSTKDNYQTEAQYIDTLKNRGLAKLNERAALVSFKSEIVNLSNFGIKYNLGDIITCRSNKYRMRLDTRITGYEQRVENNIAKIYLTLGEPTITAITESSITS